jgi:hypothetical protein
MKVISYLKTVPLKNSNPQKPEILKKFIQGVNACGDNGIVSNSDIVQPSDVAIIQGWVYSDISTPHLKLRKQLIDTQTVVSGDANLFLYKDKTNPHGYIRYSFNGIFPTTGIYCDTEIDPIRWQQISKDTTIQLENYKTNGQHILLLLQRNKGWSLKGTDVQQWTVNTINQLRKYTNRPIVIRTHPGDKTARTYILSLSRSLQHMRNVTISNIGTALQQDLNNAWAVINHNSSAAVGPIIQGYHCFLTDPIDSQCAEVSNKDFSKIETPLEFDRQKWLERISMFHWKFSELEDGSCWNHMRKYI